MDKSEWDERSLDNYDKEDNLKESLMLNPMAVPEEKFTREGKSYYYTRTLDDGTVEPITSGNFKLPNLFSIGGVEEAEEPSTDWTLKDLAYPLNVPFGGKKQNNLGDWAFTNWLVNAAPSQLGAARTGIKAAKGKYFYRPPGKQPINVTPTPSPNVSGTGNQAIIPKYAQSAKIYVGDNLPTSIFQHTGTNVSAKLGVEGFVTAASTGIAERMVTGKTKDHRLMRERVSADNPTALAYRELITKYDNLKANIGDATLDTVIPQAEFEADVRQLIELKSEDGLDLPSKTSFSKELGNFAIDGNVQYWGSKGVLKPVSIAGKERVESQGQLPATVEFDPERPKWKDFFNSIRHKTAVKLGLKKPEKDHLIRLKNQEAILSKTLNNAGEFVRRPIEFMNQLAGELHRRGHHLGDQNLNWLMMSELAHRTGKYSRHVVSQDMTDAELPKTLAEAQQQQLFLHDGRTIVAEHKNGKYYLDGAQIKPKEIKSKGNYFFAGKEYEKGQRQGLSLTTRKILAKIDNPKDLADAYELFATDAGAHEIMSGIQTAASFIYDNDAELDALSKQIRNENIPNMIKFLKYTLKNVPQYKDDPVYTKLLNRFTNKLQQNMTEFGEALEFDDTRPSAFIETKDERDARIR